MSLFFRSPTVLNKLGDTVLSPNTDFSPLVMKGVVGTMETYDVRCPLCGTINHNLYLEETDGWLECDHCRQAVQILAYAKTSRIPVYTAAELAKKYFVAAK